MLNAHRSPFTAHKIAFLSSTKFQQPLSTGARFCHTLQEGSVYFLVHECLRIWMFIGLFHLSPSFYTLQARPMSFGYCECASNLYNKLFLLQIYFKILPSESFVEIFFQISLNGRFKSFYHLKGKLAILTLRFSLDIKILWRLGFYKDIKIQLFGEILYI